MRYGNYEYPVTILTATYNRADCIGKLYESLKAQTVQDFQWLVIDDGSEDETEQLIGSFSPHSFRLDYVKKENGGKHTALNYSHRYIQGELCCIVDSDDWLLPEAIEEIIGRWKEFSRIDNVKLMTFLKGYSGSDAVEGSFPETPVISNHLDFRINDNRPGDCCEVLLSDVLKEFPFPEFKGEKFMGEGYLWNNAGFKYDTVYINKVIYICEYLEGGLTKSGRRLRIKCPKGGMENCNSFFGSAPGRRVNLKTLIKEAWLFICYGKFDHLKYKEIAAKCKKPELIKSNYIFGYMLYLYWNHKYGD